MNTTSPPASEVSTDARSPARSIAGPLLIRSGAPSSAAMIIAIVVLPSPGGPDSSTWSGALPRRSAPSSTSVSCSRSLAWPTNSASCLGRSAPSICRSPASASGDTNRSVSLPVIPVSRSRPAQHAQRRPERRRDVDLGGSAGARHAGARNAGAARLAAGQQFRLDDRDRLVGIPGLPAEAHQAGAHLVPPGQGADAAEPGGRAWPGGTRGPRPLAGLTALARRPEPPGQFEHDPLRPLAPDAGHAGQSRDVLGRHGAAQPVGAEGGQHRQRQPRPDAAGGLQQLERIPLVVAAEPVQGQGVLADHERCADPGPLARPKRGEGPRRALDKQADSPDLDHRSLGSHRRHHAIQVRDHRPDPPPATVPAPVPAAACLAWAPPRHRWQIASASASAASAGRGGSDIRSSLVTMWVTCALSARPLPVTAALTSLGVCSATGSPCRAAHSMATAPACAVPITVRTLCWLNTRSTATASGRYSPSQASIRSSSTSSLLLVSAPAGVLITVVPTSRTAAPWPTSTTPSPHRVRPGSTPSTRMRPPPESQPNTCSPATLPAGSAQAG